MGTLAYEEHTAGSVWGRPGATERVPRPEVVRDAACSGGDDQDQRVDAQSFGKTEGVDGTGLGDRREG